MRDNRYLIAGSLAAFIILLDQATKLAADKFIPRNVSIKIIDGFFDLINIRNRGAAFGFLNNPEIEWQFWLFMVAGLVAVLIIWWVLRDSKYDLFLICGLGSILGGAIGNMIDRIRMREVIDFLDFYIGHWHWPAFNVADIAICIGAFSVILSILRESRQKCR